MAEFEVRAGGGACEVGCFTILANETLQAQRQVASQKVPSRDQPRYLA